MINNKLFSVGQAVGIYHFTSLPISKISLLEKTMVFNEKRYVVGRILGFEESSTLKTVPENNLLIITINGFII